MIKNHIENINALKNAVERMHCCKAFHVEEIALIENFGPKTVWQGIVRVFRIEGHPQTDICYAWSSPIGGSKKRRYYAVLKLPPINSAEGAVRASIVHNHKLGKL